MERFKSKKNCRVQTTNIIETKMRQLAKFANIHEFCYLSKELIKLIISINKFRTQRFF